MIINENNCLLLIIDIQEKLLKAVFNKDIVEKKSEILVKAFNILDIPIIVTEQYPQGLGETVGDLKLGAKLFIKTQFDAISDKELLSTIKNSGKKQIIVSGIETHICVHQTVESLIKNGFEVTVVKDACGSRSELEYRAGLSYMQNNGAQIKTTEMILFELLKGAKHTKFKEIQTLIK